jgi:hypothetical protein
MEIEMRYAAKAIEYCPGIGSPNPVVKPKEWLELGDETIKNILTEIILINKWNEAVKARQIDPLAENFIRTVLEIENYDKLSQENKKSQKNDYKTKLKQKMSQSKSTK